MLDIHQVYQIYIYATLMLEKQFLFHIPVQHNTTATIGILHLPV